MTYERFSELWDEIISHPIKTGMTDKTAKALIAYANGDKRAVEEARFCLNERIV